MLDVKCKSFAQATLCANCARLCGSMVLADDLNGDGYMDLLATSLNGNVYLVETGGVYLPMRAWTAEVC